MLGNKTPKEWLLETGQSCMLIKRAVNQTKYSNYYLRCLGRTLQTGSQCKTTINGDDGKLSLQRKAEIETFLQRLFK